MSSIELEIDDEDWPTYKKYFLMIHPNQTLDSDSPLSDDDWIRYRILLFARGTYEKGFAQEYAELNGPDPDLTIIT